ncbi:hypothetical protein [Frigoribacterium sp. CFBP 13712]|uniref:hypothetical protein n=1 Tax=Frigoribacterium sp. CFBP 13712 TaxID=2775309 RepID=UPI0017809E7F|nr:hypothetical protein [Frigoribacterium sp. CFBP 13712]MBD8704556.1 hypothetical protein [Frigoribacterium sp. CFBP 13712]
MTDHQDDEDLDGAIEPYSDEADDFLRARGWLSRRSDTDRGAPDDVWEWPPTQQDPWRAATWVHFTGEVFQIHRAEHKGFFSMSGFQQDVQTFEELAAEIPLVEVWPLTLEKASAERTKHRHAQAWAKENNTHTRDFAIAEPYASRMNDATNAARAGAITREEAERRTSRALEEAWVAYCCVFYAGTEDGVRDMKRFAARR